MKRSPSSKRKAVVLPIIAIVSLGMLAGCELLVDFDRTLIDGGALGDVDGSLSDVALPNGDSATDSSTVTDSGDAATDGSTVTDSGDAAITDASDAEVDADI